MIGPFPPGPFVALRLHRPEVARVERVWVGPLARPGGWGCSICALSQGCRSNKLYLSAESACLGMRSAAEYAPSTAHSADRSQFEPPERAAAQAASHAKRKDFSPRGRRKSGALTPQMSGQMCIQALCFGDFHLCQQMKVTRPPGRDPATDRVSTLPRPAQTPLGTASHG